MKQRHIKRPDLVLTLPGQAPSPALAAGEDRPEGGVAEPRSVVEATRQETRHSGVVPAEEVISIPVTKLRVSPHNARKNRLPKRISKIAESLKANGQKDPLYVYPGVDGDAGYFMVLGGETRRLGALQIALPELKAFVDRSVDPRDALTLTKISHILNDSADECDLDLGMVASDLIGQGYTQKDVAEALDLESHTQVQRLFKLATLPKRFVDFGQDFPERFSASLGALIYQAIDHHGEDFAFGLLRAAITEDLTHKKIAKAIELGRTGDQVEHGRGKRLRHDSGFDIPALDSPGGRYDIYRAKTPGRKVLKLEVELSEELAKELNDQLTETLNKFIASQNINKE